MRASFYPLLGVALALGMQALGQAASGPPLLAQVSAAELVIPAGAVGGALLFCWRIATQWQKVLDRLDNLPCQKEPCSKERLKAKG